FEPISLSKIRVVTRSANKSLGDEVAYRQSVAIPIFGKRIEPVALLPVFYPDLLIAECTNQIEPCIQVDVVCAELFRKNGITSQIVVVIADHQGHFDTRPGDFDLVENRLVASNDVI